MRARLPLGGLLVRAVILIAPLAAILSGVPQGYRPPLWLVAAVGILGFAAAAAPDHYVGSAALILVVAWWVTAIGSALPLSSVAAAGALLASHVAATVAAYGPRYLSPDRGIALLWVRRGVALWAASALTWVVVVAGSGRATSTAYWVAGLVVVLALVVFATMVFPAPGDRRM
ncbi:MAG TPA: hypothetical protein VHW64_00365 [Nocardioides sp.]|jgi:hypothetical protein|uniref:hypothetical protein n=1 Tax=Nocardioides sp. TaxID=35761 RepID=UPI002E30FA40|nr:hypothetical protein [Nocardioides sp.]HEX3929126.1 hypothetical protein [Nocardioides sp.]